MNPYWIPFDTFRPLLTPVKNCFSLPVSQENSEDEAFVDVVKPDELPEPDLEPEDLSLEPELELLSLFLLIL